MASQIEMPWIQIPPPPPTTTILHPPQVAASRQFKKINFKKKLILKKK